MSKPWAVLIWPLLPLCAPLYAQVVTIGGYHFNIAPYTPGDVTNFTNPPPEAAPDPAKNVCWASPNYFFDICKAAGTTEFPAAEAGGVIRPIYSRWRNDNSDGSLYFVEKNGETPPGSGSGQTVIYRTADNSVFRVINDVPSHEYYEFRWDYSGQYPYRLYHIDDACGFHRYDVSVDGSSATDTLIRDFAPDFPGCGRILNDVEGDSSIDSRYWAFMVNGPYDPPGCEGDYYLKAIMVYDREANQILGVLDRAKFVALGGTGTDWDGCGYRPNMVDMSPLGTKVIALWPRTDRQDAFDGPHAYNKDFSGTAVKVCNDETHSGWGFDLDGSELFVCQVDNSNWPGRPADTVAATNIVTGGTRAILFHSDMNFETGYHFGRIYNPAIRGWVFVTTSSDTATATSFLRSHAFFLELRSSDQHPRIWRVADLHNNFIEGSEGAYYREAYAPLSGDGLRFYWGADWVTSAQGAPGNLTITSTGVVNTYKVTLPPRWWELLQTGQFTISGTVRTAGGQGIPGVTINFDGGPSPVTDSSGNYSAAVAAGYTGTATPSLSGYTFSPTNRAYNNVGSNQSGQDYTGNLAPPDLLLAPGSPQSFPYTQLSGAPSQTLNVNAKSTSATVNLSYSLLVTSQGGASCNWLSFTPGSGTANHSPGDTFTINAGSVCASALSVGSYPGNIQVTAPGASTSVQNYAVNLNILAAPAIGSAPPGSTPFHATVGMPVPTGTQSFTISAGGTAFTAAFVPNAGPPTNGALWLTLNTVASVVTASLNGAVVGTLAPNTYAGNIQIADANTSNSPFNIPVSLVVSPSSGLQLVAITPCRVLDTRNPNGNFGGPFLSGGTSRAIPIPSGSCGIPGSAVAYSLNVTVVPRAGSLGFLTVWPTGQAQPSVSTLNSPDGAIVANAAIVPAGASGSVSVFTTNDTDVIFDINGYFLAPGAGTLQFYPLTPCRLVDTRNANGTFGGSFIPAGTSRDFPVQSSPPPCAVPATAHAYSLNLTAVPRPGKSLGFLTAYPTGASVPAASTLNTDTNVRANAAIVQAGTPNGSVGIFANNDTDVVIDINGYFAPPAAGGMNFFTVTPCRVADTRNSPNGPLAGPLMDPAVPATDPRIFPVPASCGLPSTAGAYSLNMTVVPPGFLGYLTTWPAGSPQPFVSTLNDPKGIIMANAALVPAGTGGSINVYVLQPTHVVIDTNGYFQ